MLERRTRQKGRMANDHNSLKGARSLAVNNKARIAEALAKKLYTEANKKLGRVSKRDKKVFMDQTA